MSEISRGTPFIDVDEWRDAPRRHRYVHGGFKDTHTRFSFYLPPKEQSGDVHYWLGVACSAGGDEFAARKHFLIAAQMRGNLP